MAEIVLGVGTSHTPQLNMGPDLWEDHARRDVTNPMLIGQDGEVHTYQDLLDSPAAGVGDELGDEIYRAKHERVQHALQVLSERLSDAAPDAVVVVGDDQGELFSSMGIPAIGVYCGASVWDFPSPPERLERLSAGMRAARWASHAAEPYEHLVADDLARHVVEELTAAEFDLMKIERQPEGSSIGHAFTFVRYCLGLPATTPMVPVLLNTYVPPNVLSPGRCYRLGRALRAAVEAYGGVNRVAVIGSGGLSHFVVLEEFDRAVLQALQERDEASIGAFSRRYFRSGTSETLNWITAAGALEHLDMRVVDYVPGHRSPAGTGTGMAFALWE